MATSSRSSRSNWSLNFSKMVINYFLFDHAFLNASATLCPDLFGCIEPPEWVTARFSLFPDIGHPGSRTIFHQKSFSFVGSMSLQARHINIRTARGNLNCQNRFQMDLDVEDVELLPWTRAHLSTSRWYALRTEKIPVLVPAQINLSACVWGLIAML